MQASEAEALHPGASAKGGAQCHRIPRVLL